MYFFKPLQILFFFLFFLQAIHAGAIRGTFFDLFLSHHAGQVFSKENIL